MPATEGNPPNTPAAPAAAPALPAGRTPVSVLVPTLNEAEDLPACLEHLAFAEQVCVVDSGSTDATARLLQERGKP